MKFKEYSLKCVNRKSGSIGFQGTIQDEDDETLIENRCPKDCYRWDVIR